MTATQLLMCCGCSLHPAVSLSEWIGWGWGGWPVAQQAVVRCALRVCACAAGYLTCGHMTAGMPNRWIACFCTAVCSSWPVAPVVLSCGCSVRSTMQGCCDSTVSVRGLGPTPVVFPPFSWLGLCVSTAAYSLCACCWLGQLPALQLCGTLI
jgi:hypothetical protein